MEGRSKWAGVKQVIAGLERLGACAVMGFRDLETLIVSTEMSMSKGDLDDACLEFARDGTIFEYGMYACGRIVRYRLNRSRWL